MKIQAASYWKIAVWFFISRRFVSEKGDVMDAQFTAEDFPGGTPSPLTVRVAQGSAVIGWGAAVERGL